MSGVLWFILGILPILPPDDLGALIHPFLQPVADVFPLWQDPLYAFRAEGHVERVLLPFPSAMDPLVFQDREPIPYLQGTGEQALTFLFSQRGSQGISDVGILFGNRYGGVVPVGFALRKTDREDGSAQTLAFSTGYEPPGGGVSALAYHRSWNWRFRQRFSLIRLRGERGAISGALSYAEASGLDNGRSLWGEIGFRSLTLAGGLAGSLPFGRLSLRWGPLGLWGGKVGSETFWGGSLQKRWRSGTFRVSAFRTFPFPNTPVWDPMEGVHLLFRYGKDSTFSAWVEGGAVRGLLVPGLTGDGDSLRRSFSVHFEDVDFWAFVLRKILPLPLGFWGQGVLGCGGTSPAEALPASGCRFALSLWRPFRWREVDLIPGGKVRGVGRSAIFWEVRLRAVFYEAVVIEAGGYNLTDVREIPGMNLPGLSLTGRHYRVRVGVRLFD